MALPDIAGTDCWPAFCSYNVGRESACNGHHSSNPRHGFWRTLSKTGLTPVCLRRIWIAGCPITA